MATTTVTTIVTTMGTMTATAMKDMIIEDHTEATTGLEEGDRIEEDEVSCVVMALIQAEVDI